jgi:hypothetical protein
MTIPLFSATEMQAFQDVALQGMQSQVTIYRRTTISTDDGMTSQWTQIGVVPGWIYSVPTQHQSLVSGEIATINTYRLFVPVGTDIAQSDKVLVLGQAQEFVVSDTIDENTWQAVLRVSLRFAE